MSERVWTEGQRAAIDTRGSDLLVSASAGSGKTAVLIERIIKHILDVENKTDISEMLIVTFTEAAAKQLKNKLSDALKLAIARDQGNKHLRRQLTLLPRASISTIDGFCLELVKSNFSHLGLSSGIRIADAAENALILKEIMEECIEEFYERGNELGIEDFALFCNTYAELADDGIGSVFLDIYEKLYTRREGLELLLRNAEELEATCDSDPFENKWGEVIRRRTLMYLNSVSEKYKTAFDILNFDPSIDKSYGTVMREDQEIIDSMRKALDEGYFEVMDLFADTTLAKSIGSYRGENKEDAKLVKDARDYFKNAYVEIASYYSNGRNTASQLALLTAKNNRELYAFLKYFHEKAMEEKRKKAVVSFADCEAMSLWLLCRDDEPTDIARAYRERYSEVYIDEYQDINSIQDMIFRMVARPGSRFLVGDIKQSIYGFRGADPTLFGSYRDRFTDYTSDEESEGKRIFLSNNFRSSKNVIDFANAVSRGCFVDGESKVGFYEGDNLVFSKVREDIDDHCPVTVAGITQNEAKNAESVYICDEIEGLLAKGVSPGEITILLRGMGASASITEEMEKRGIPYYCSSKKQFFDNPEISLALCWLYTIDNTRRDVYVCGLLKSPVYNVTLNELTLIRQEFPRATLFDSVKAYSEAHDWAKGKRFLSDTAELRAYAKGRTARELLWLLMYEKKLINAVTKGKSPDMARLAKNNILLLYDTAKSFENGEFKALNNFVRYIDDIISAKHAMPNASAFAGAGDTVKIMTIHKSKGLEFPYCFIAHTQSLCEKRDMRKKILFDEELGVASLLAVPSGLGYLNSYIMDALRLSIEESIIESDYLVLYVALTRAVNRLWVTFCDRDASAFVDKYIDERISKIYTITKYRYIQWILPSLKYAPKGSYELVLVAPDSIGSLTKYVEESDEEQIDPQRLAGCIDFEYKYKRLSTIPAKVAVSKLYPDILDDEVSFDMTAILEPKEPFFARKEINNKGADVGNATHAFMQFCDFDRVEDRGVEAELELLYEKAFLSEEALKLVDTDALKKFFTSDIYRQMRSSKKLYREKRFNVNLEASEFTSEYSEELKGENVLVQGVIDCFFYDEEGSITLLDYKTDRVPEYMTREEGKAMLTERHSTQLKYYKMALERLTGDKVVRMLLYSFALGDIIDI